MIMDNFSKTKFNSLVRGIVTNNDDPEKLGRIQVRIYSRVSSVEMGNIKDESLPWATPCFTGASPNSGMFILPEVGDVVFILFENGDSFRPVYLGGIYGQGTEKVKEIGNTVSRKRVVKAKTNELPVEALNADKKIVYKSPKGTKIFIDDTDGKESFSIVDPCGQIIGLTSPMTDDFSKDNNHLDNSNTINRKFDKFSGIKNKAIMIFKSLSGSFFRITSKTDNSEVVIKADGAKSADIKMTGGTDGSILLQANNKGTNVISMDADGILLQCGTSAIKITEKEISLKVGTSHIVIDSKNITEKTLTSCINQSSSGVEVKSVTAIAMKSNTTVSLKANAKVECNSASISMRSLSYRNVSGGIGVVPGSPSFTPSVVAPNKNSPISPITKVDIEDDASNLF